MFVRFVVCFSIYVQNTMQICSSCLCTEILSSITYYWMKKAISRLPTLASARKACGTVVRPALSVVLLSFLLLRFVECDGFPRL